VLIAAAVLIVLALLATTLAAAAALLVTVRICPLVACGVGDRVCGCHGPAGWRWC
jgi:hypothetical protein